MKKYLLPLILIFVLLFTSLVYADLFGTYDKRIKLTVDQTDIDSDLTWFPVTVFFTATQGEEIFAEFDADEDFDRIAFTTFDGETQLYAENKLFDDSESKAIYYVSKTGWVLDSDVDTNFYCYFDNDAAHNITYVGKPGIARGTYIPLVTFSLEDGYDDDYTDWKPLFDTQGEIGCIAIVTDLVNSTGFVTWAQVIAFQNAGWEITNHTKTHPDLTTLNEAQIRAEIEGSNSAFEANGITTNIFGYPFALNNELVKNIVAEYFQGARNKPTAEGGQGVNPQNIEPYNLMFKTADDTTIANLKADVDTAKAENRWVIFYMHNYTSDKGTKINELIDYIQAQNVDIVTCQQGLNVFAKVSGYVYNPQYKAVCHMVDATTSTLNDSTANNFNFTKCAANKPLFTNGELQDFSGITDEDFIKQATLLDTCPANGTISILLKPDVYLPGSISYIFNKINVDTLGKDFLGIRYEATSKILIMHNFNNVGFVYLNSTTVLNINIYYLITLTWGTDGLRLYINETNEASNATTNKITDGTYADLFIGSYRLGNYNFDGKIKEFRVDQTQRPAYWIKATYNSLLDTLLNYGSEETTTNILFIFQNF